MSSLSPAQKIGSLTLQSQDLTSLKPSELIKHLQDVFTKNVEKGDPEKVFAILNQAISVIPLKNLEEGAEIRDLLQQATDLFEIAKLYLDKEKPSHLSVYLQSVLEVLTRLLESLMNAFGFGDFFEPSESQEQAERKSYKIMQMTHTFTMLSSVLLPLIGEEFGPKILAGIVISIAGLSLIWSKIKPMINYLPANGKNWSKVEVTGSFLHQVPPALLEDIEKVFESGKHPILVGTSRVGKSLTAKAFAAYMTTKGKRVFQINTSNLIDRVAPSGTGGGNNILEDISKAMGVHRKDIVLVLDEIHMACAPDRPLADQMKPFLDEEGDFPMVMGITTQKEYEDFVKKNVAFSNRFKPVSIVSMEKEETLRVLSRTVLKKASKPILEEQVLTYIYEKTGEGVPQPFTAKNLLNDCITCTRECQVSETEKKIRALSAKILSIRSQDAVYGTTTNLQQLKEDLAKLQATFESEKLEVEKLFKLKEAYHLTRKMAYESVLKVAEIGKDNLVQKRDEELKRLLLADKLLKPILFNLIRKKSTEVGMVSIVDKSLVDTVLAGS